MLPALCVDGFVVVGWLSLAALLLPRRRPPIVAVDEAVGRPFLSDLPHPTENEPRAMAPWRGRHWP
ncbi:hypothetical protein ACFVUH_16110 [Kitasatospora sp. NPDC058032]|uniref:hypothetical protein n=1 Tax=unclassified Kitasatospora TaxID=2633591 RepID=UPI0033A526E5